MSTPYLDRAKRCSSVVDDGTSRSAQEPVSLGAQRRIWLLESLQIANALIAECDAVEPSLQNIADELRRRVSLTTVAIGLIEGDEIVFHGVSSRESTHVVRVPVSSGITGRVVRTGVSELVEDVANDPDYIPVSPSIVREVAVPILVEGIVHGVLNVEAARDVALDADEFDVMTSVATALGLAIERSRRRDDERRRLSQLASLQQITGRISGRERVDENVADILDEIAGAFNFDFVSLGIVDGETIRFHSSFDAFTRDSYPTVSFPVGSGITGRVARTGEPAFVADVTQDPDYERIRPETLQEICVPIYVAGEVFGVLNVEVNQHRRIDEGDLNIVTSLGDHLGLVIANQRRISQLEQLNQQLRTVERVAAVIAGKLLIREALPDVLNEIERGFGYGTTGVGLIEGDQLVFHAIRERPGIQGDQRVYVTRGIPLGKGVTGRVATSGVAEFIPDVTMEPDYIPTASGVRSEICVPIRVEDRTVGVINVETMARRPLNEHDFEILSIIADHLGIALQKGDLYVAEQESRKAIEAIQRVSTIVASTLDVDEALQLIVRTLADVFGYPFVSLRLLEGEELVLAASSNALTAATARSFKVGEGVLGRVATTGVAELIVDVDSDPAYVSSKHGMRSEVCVPISCNGELAGVLNIEGDESRPVSDQDLILMKTFAQHAGSVIQNARMYARMEHLATRDPVTGLPNHREFQIRLREEISRASRGNQDVSLLLIDLDSFKQVNDTYGHVVGDDLLSGVARRLSDCLRDGDVLARYGGDEFVVILPETDTASALQVASRLSASLLSAPLSVGDSGQEFLSVSIGSATFPVDGTSAVELIKRADTAMYSVKRRRSTNPRSSSISAVTSHTA